MSRNFPTALQRESFFKPGNQAAKGRRKARTGKRTALHKMLAAKLESPDAATELTQQFFSFMMAGEPWAWGLAAKVLRWDRLTPEDDEALGGGVVQMLQRIPADKKRMLRELAETVAREKGITDDDNVKTIEAKLVK